MIEVTTTIEWDAEREGWRPAIPQGVDYVMDVADFERLRSTSTAERAALVVKVRAAEKDRKKLEDALLVEKV